MNLVSLASQDRSGFKLFLYILIVCVKDFILKFVLKQAAGKQKGAVT